MADEGISLASLAQSSLNAVVSKFCGEVFGKLFQDSKKVDLSDEAYRRIENIFVEVLDSRDFAEQKEETRTILKRLHDSINDKDVPLQDLVTHADENMDRLSGETYDCRVTDAYLAAAGQALLLYRFIYDRKADAEKPGAAINIVTCAVGILDDLSKFEKDIYIKDGLEIFSTFKRYTLGQHEYSELDTTSPLSYMGKNYRESVQRVMQTIARYDATETELAKLNHPRYVLNFFDYESVQDKVMWLWNASHSKRTVGGDKGKPQDCIFWMCFPFEDYSPLGDLCITSGSFSPTTVPYIKVFDKGRLMPAQDYTQIYRDHGTYNPNELSGWNPVPPEGFEMISSVINRSQDDKPDNRCVVLPSEYVDMRKVGKRTWNSNLTGSIWGGSTFAHPEPTFARSGLFTMERSTIDVPSNTQVGVIKSEALEGYPFLDQTPKAPDFDPGNWTQSAGYGTSGRWAAGYKVRYRVAFYSQKGQILGPWWHPTHWPGSDSDGYYGDKWACPTLTISVDFTDKATGRIIYRQFEGRDPEVVAVIANNTETSHLDTVDAPSYGPPASAPDFDPGNWAGGPESTNWAPGYKVRYAVSFYAADGETPMGPWWHPTHWPGSDADGYYGDKWAYPLLTNIPVDLTHTATGRRIYRQFRGGSVELVGEIANNTDTSFGDKKP